MSTRAGNLLLAPLWIAVTPLIIGHGTSTGRRLQTRTPSAEITIAGRCHSREAQNRLPPRPPKPMTAVATSVTACATDPRPETAAGSIAAITPSAAAKTMNVAMIPATATITATTFQRREGTR